MNDVGDAGGIQRWGESMVMVQSCAACPIGCPRVSVSCLRDKGGGLVTVFIIFCRTAVQVIMSGSRATKILSHEGNE